MKLVHDESEKRFLRIDMLIDSLNEINETISELEQTIWKANRNPNWYTRRIWMDALDMREKILKQIIKEQEKRNQTLEG